MLIEKNYARQIVRELRHARAHGTTPPARRYLLDAISCYVTEEAVTLRELERLRFALRELRAAVDKAGPDE